MPMSTQLLCCENSVSVCTSQLDRVRQVNKFNPTRPTNVLRSILHFHTLRLVETPPGNKPLENIMKMGGEREKSGGFT